MTEHQLYTKIPTGEVQLVTIMVQTMGAIGMFIHHVPLLVAAAATDIIWTGISYIFTG